MRWLLLFFWTLGFSNDQIFDQMFLFEQKRSKFLIQQIQKLKSPLTPHVTIQNVDHFEDETLIVVHSSH